MIVKTNRWRFSVKCGKSWTTILWLFGTFYREPPTRVFGVCRHFLQQYHWSAGFTITTMSKDAYFIPIISLHSLIGSNCFGEVTSYDYIIIDYLHISFHGNFVDDVRGKKRIHMIGTGKLQMASRS